MNDDVIKALFYLWSISIVFRFMCLKFNSIIIRDLKTHPKVNLCGGSDNPFQWPVGSMEFFCGDIRVLDLNKLHIDWRN